MATKKKASNAGASSTEPDANAAKAAATAPSTEAEAKAIISSHPNGFVHQGELLALLQNFEDRIAKLEELAGVESGEELDPDA